MWSRLRADPRKGSPGRLQERGNVPPMSASLRVVMPTAILLLAALLAVVLIQTRPEAHISRPAQRPLLVSVLEANPAEVQFTVASHGRVEPRTQTRLVAEVRGKITWISPKFEAGAMLRAGEVLLTIDRQSFEAAVAAAEAQLARAERELATERARAGYAESDYQRLRQLDATPIPASDLTLRKPQLAAALAELNAARAALDEARQDLERTRVVTPYDALVREKLADLGQYVTPGTALARLFAIDFAEVRLPLTLSDLDYLPVTELERDGIPMPAELQAPIAGTVYVWPASVVRSEGVIDPTAQTLKVVARIPDPYGLRHPERAPLRFGTFVAANIRGKRAADVITLPRHALVDGDRVWRVTADDRLEAVSVDVLRRARDVVHLRAGLAPGDRICITPIPGVRAGTEVRVRGAGPGDTPPQVRAAGGCYHGRF